MVIKDNGQGFGFGHVDDGTLHAVEMVATKARDEIDALLVQLKASCDAMPARRPPMIEGGDAELCWVACGCGVTMHQRGECNVVDAEFPHDDLGRLFFDIESWQRATFPAATRLSVAMHMASELGEYIAAVVAHEATINETTATHRGASLRFAVEDAQAKLRDGARKKAGPVGPEIADLAHMLVAMAHTSGVDVLVETAAKFEKNKARTWKAPDRDGVVEHATEAPSFSTTCELHQDCEDADACAAALNATSSIHPSKAVHRNRRTR